MTFLEKALSLRMYLNNVWGHENLIPENSGVLHMLQLSGIKNRKIKWNKMGPGGLWGEGLGTDPQVSFYGMQF